MEQFDSKVAIVTGGSQGLGAAIAALFIERGACGVVICGRAKEKGEAKARELSRLGEAGGGRGVFLQADLANVDDRRKVVSAADQHFGRVDVLVNTAALTDLCTRLDTDPA